MIYQITQSLLSSWEYAFKAGTDDAFTELQKALIREKEAPTEAMLNGIEFENEVYKQALHKQRESHAKWEDGIREVAALIEGAPTQIKLTKSIATDRRQYMLVGVLDALQAGVIYDVKFCTKSLRSNDIYGKYLNSPQHPAYFYLVPEAQEFRYLISDGDSVYIETYRREDTQDIKAIIEAFEKYLADAKLEEIYESRWTYGKPKYSVQPVQEECFFRCADCGVKLLGNIKGDNLRGWAETCNTQFGRHLCLNCAEKIKPGGWWT